MNAPDMPVKMGSRLSVDLEDVMKAVLPEPSGAPIRLGARLRASRKAQGLTIQQVAAATNLTKGFVSRVERDETSPSCTSSPASWS
jgi:Helix-turn-helix domain